jgi:hypothetical protein
MAESKGRGRLAGYSIFGIDVDRRNIAKWLFPQEKAAFHGPKEDYMYSENALATGKPSLG